MMNRKENLSGVQIIISRLNNLTANIKKNN